MLPWYPLHLFQFKYALFFRLRYLSVCNVYSLTDKTMHEISQKARGLVALDIRGCWRITDRGINAVSEYCKDLKVLHVADCR